MSKNNTTFIPDDHTRRNYFILPNAIFSRGLSTGALVVYMYLALHQDKLGESVTSVETIGEHLKISKKQLQITRRNWISSG